MNPSAAALAAILLSAGAGSVTADEGIATANQASPDEVIKIRALRLAYFLNADRMVRATSLGSIDVSGLLFVPDASLIERPAAVRQVPISPIPDTTPPAPVPRPPRPQ